MNFLNFTKALLLIATLVVTHGAFANLTEARNGLNSSYVISGNDLGQVERLGQIDLKEAIERKISNELPSGTRLNSVTVYAQAYGPDGWLSLYIGNAVQDRAFIYLDSPDCHFVNNEVISNHDAPNSVISRRGGICTNPIPSINKVTLVNQGKDNSHQPWILSTNFDVRVLSVYVNTTVPKVYNIERQLLGSNKVNKGFGSTYKFQLDGSVDSLQIKATKRDIKLKKVEVYFADGSSLSLPNVKQKITRGPFGLLVFVGQPFKDAVSVSVKASSKGAFGSRGIMKVSADYITSNID